MKVCYHYTLTYSFYFIIPYNDASVFLFNMILIPPKDELLLFLHADVVIIVSFPILIIFHIVFHLYVPIYDLLHQL